MKKLVTYILSGIGILLLVVLGLLVAGVNLYTIGAFIVKVVSYVGNGSVVLGIIFTPFFIFGVILIIRSFLLIGNKVQEEAEEGLFIFMSKKSHTGFNFGSLYVFLSFISYLLVFFIIAIPARTENSYNDGFREGVQIAEEYARECYNELASEVEDIYGVDISKASGIIQEYEDSGFKHITNDELINAQFALDYFCEKIWYSLCEIDTVPLELGEIPSN